jgi:hypothetical protein
MHLTLPRKKINKPLKNTILKFHRVIGGTKHKLSRKMVERLMGYPSHGYTSGILLKMLRIGAIIVDDSGPIILYYSHIPNAVVKEELGL